MPAVSAGNPVALSQVHAYTCSNGLLAGVKVHKTRHFSSRKLDVQTLFEIADGPHSPISFKQRAQAQHISHTRIDHDLHLLAPQSIVAPLAMKAIKDFLLYTLCVFLEYVLHNTSLFSLSTGKYSIIPLTNVLGVATRRNDAARKGGSFLAQPGWCG